MQVYDIPLDQTHMETTRHGSLEFPLAIYTTRINRNILGYIDWHWHHELQFCVVTQGEVDFRVDKEELSLKEGEGIFINAEQIHMARNHPGSDGTYFCMDFHPRLIWGFDGGIVQSGYVMPYLKNKAMSCCRLSGSIPWQAEMLDLLMMVYRMYHSPERDEMQICIWLSELWHKMICSYSSSERPDKKMDTISPQVRTMLEYIRENYAMAVSLDDIAEQAALAKSTCCREFKKQIGCTIFEHLLNVRLQEASRLLLTSGLSITEISLECGFSNSSYFTKEFRRKTGCSPSAYRKENRVS